MTEVSRSLPVGASPWEKDLYAHLAGHVQQEQELLTQYRSAATESPSKALSYLIKLLIEDEIRHHMIFTALADSLRADAEMGGKNPSIPYMDFDQADQPTVAKLTDALLTNERSDAEELKRLQRELRPLKDTTLWALLVELMERDTQKHIAILKFVKTHSRRRVPRTT